MPHDHCYPSRRGHTWREPDPAMLPDRPRRQLADLRVCQRCGVFGRINSQGVILIVTMQEAKAP